MSNEILVEVSNKIMVITINRPEARNAVNGAVAQGIADAMDELDSNPDIHAAILTGAGGTLKRSRIDWKKGNRSITIIEGRGFAGLTEKGPKKPLIAAIGVDIRSADFLLLLPNNLAVSATITW